MFDNDNPIFAKTIKTEKKEFKSTNKLVSLQDLNAVLYSMNEVKKIIDKYNVDEIYCELSTAGGKSSSAVKGLAYSFGILAAPIIYNGLNYKTCTPNEVKKYVYGKTSGDKEGIMDYVANTYGLERKGTKFYFCNEWFWKGEFEHIADAYIVYEVINGKER